MAEMHESAPSEANLLPPDDPLVRMTRTQIRHFRTAHCRTLELPEGVLLRYTLVPSLYFYLRSGVQDGQIRTELYASDSAYERQKTAIGQVRTPLFDSQADREHLNKIERLLRNWVRFVEQGESGPDFISFPVAEVRRDD